MARTSPSAGEASKRSDRETVVTLRLPRELHDRLKVAAGERGFAADVRQRLERSFGPSIAGMEQQTIDLLSMIAEGAPAVAALRRPWYSDPNAFEVYKATVILLLEGFRPEGEPNPNLDATYEAIAVIGLATRVLGDRALDFILRTREVALAGERVKPVLPNDERREAFKT